MFGERNNLGRQSIALKSNRVDRRVLLRGLCLDGLVIADPSGEPVRGKIAVRERQHDATAGLVADRVHRFAQRLPTWTAPTRPDFFLQDAHQLVAIVRQIRANGDFRTEAADARAILWPKR